MGEPRTHSTPEMAFGGMIAGARPQSPASRSHWIILGLILVLGAFLRFYGLTHQSLWLDEVISVQVAQRSPAGIVEKLKTDSHPPLFYFILKGWMKLFGSSETAVRALPALFGLLLLPVLYWIGAALFGRRAGLLTALVAAVSQFHVRFSQEVRMYTLLPLLGLLSLYCLYKAVLEDKTRDWVGYGLLLTATLYTHNYGAFIAAAGAAFIGIIALGKKVSWPKYLVANGLVGLAYLPWLPVVTGTQLQNPNILGWIPRMRLWHIIETFQFYSGLVFNVFRRRLTMTIMLVGGVVFLACFLAGVFSIRKRGKFQVPYIPNQAGLVLLLCYLVVTLGLPMLISIWKPVYLPYRYSVAAWPAFVLIVGLGLAKFKKGAVRLTCLALILAVSAVGLYWYHFQWVKGTDREIAAFIESKAGPNDIIISTPKIREKPIKYYLHSPMESIGLTTSVGLHREALAQALAHLKSTGAKVFFLHEPSLKWVPYLEDMKNLLDSNFQMTEKIKIGNTIVALYELK